MPRQGLPLRAAIRPLRRREGPEGIAATSQEMRRFLAFLRHYPTRPSPSILTRNRSVILNLRRTPQSHGGAVFWKLVEMDNFFCYILLNCHYL